MCISFEIHICLFSQDIKYQVKLDMYDFCTPELQEKLLPIRKRYKEVEDKKTVSGGGWGGGGTGLQEV